MSEISWKSNRFGEQEELVSMVDLTSRITSLSTAILILFQFVFCEAWRHKIDSQMKRYIEGFAMLKERPGL